MKVVRRPLMLAVGLLFGALSSAHVAAADLNLTDCAFPDEPQIPDGATANGTEMGAAGGQVRVFVKALEDKLACLDGLQAGLGEEITADQTAMLTAAYNAGVDSMNSVAAAYNEAVKLYKAANPAN